MRTRILLVDDYPDALDVWAFYLRIRGYDVVTAVDGLTAVSKAIATHPDVIVMDLGLPGISGVEATRRLKANSDTEAIPIIAATGNTLPSQLNEAREAGLDRIVI
ncbi:MAG TPA: response regulator, partial [Vicinamibacterales bacterium]|nr:response regulator [Vicinamibacterales bacterium]